MTTITLPRATVEQALEALEMSRRFVYADNRPQCDEAIDALRAALAQQAEPVKVVQIDDTSTPHGRLATMLAEALGADHPAMADFAAIVLGASPQRKPLTEEEMDRIYVRSATPAAFGRGVERAHGIGGDDEQV